MKASYAQVSASAAWRNPGGGGITVNRALCSGCGLEVRRGRDPVTHTICPSCEAEMYQVLEAEKRRAG